MSGVKEGWATKQAVDDMTAVLEETGGCRVPLGAGPVPSGSQVLCEHPLPRGFPWLPHITLSLPTPAHCHT